MRPDKSYRVTAGGTLITQAAWKSFFLFTTEEAEGNPLLSIAGCIMFPEKDAEMLCRTSGLIKNRVLAEDQAKMRSLEWASIQ